MVKLVRDDVKLEPIVTVSFPPPFKLMAIPLTDDTGMFSGLGVTWIFAEPEVPNPTVA